MKVKIKYSLITLSIVLIVLLTTFAYALKQGCCMTPRCKECYDEFGFCICDFMEDIGIKPCEECEQHGCGKEAIDKDTCEKLREYH